MCQLVSDEPNDGHPKFPRSTETGHNPAPATNFGAVLKGALPLSVLSDDELTILVGVFYDGESQEAIGYRLKMSREWVSKRLAKAVAKLAALGIVLKPPGKGRKAVSMKSVLKYCDPMTLDRLTIDHERDDIEHRQQKTGGKYRGKWVKARRGTSEEHEE